MIYFIDQPAHDVVEQRRLIEVEAAGSGSKQVRDLPEDFCARSDVAFGNRRLKLIDQRVARHGNGGTGTAALLAAIRSVCRWCKAMRHFLLRECCMRC